MDKAHQKNKLYSKSQREYFKLLYGEQRRRKIAEVCCLFIARKRQ